MATKAKRQQQDIKHLDDAVVLGELRAAAKRKGRNYVTAPELADKLVRTNNLRTGRPRRDLARKALVRLADAGECELWTLGRVMAATVTGVVLHDADL